MGLFARQTPTYPTDSHQLSGSGETAIIISVIFSVLATVAGLLRFYARYLRRLKPFLEDWLIVVALILQWSYVAVVFLLAYDGGLGWPTPEISPGALINETKYSIAGQTNWPLAAGLVKVAIILSYKRIFSTPRFNMVANIVMVLSICWSIATVLVAYLICIPLSANWTGQTSSCGNEPAAYISIGAIDIATDIMIYLLPMPMLAKLQMPQRTKWALVGTFGLGLITVAASVARLVEVIHINFGTDFTESEVGDTYWPVIESSTGIMVSSALIMRPLLDKILSWFGVEYVASKGFTTKKKSNYYGDTEKPTANATMDMTGQFSTMPGKTTDEEGDSSQGEEEDVDLQNALRSNPNPNHLAPPPRPRGDNAV